MKFERNKPCPCGSGDKYKRCCLSTLDWNKLAVQGANPILHLSLRGKNRYFLNIIADALQLDSLGGPVGWDRIKRACTPQAVRKIHEAIPHIWPSEVDLDRVLESQKKIESGLYVGRYDVQSIFSGISRHSIYSDRILIVDPFVDPRSVRSEYNPVLHPEQHLISTLKHLRLWLTLQPWIEAGLIAFVKNPEDLNTKLAIEALVAQKTKIESNPELARLLENDVQGAKDEHEFNEMSELLMLIHSDESLVAMHHDIYPGKSEADAQKMLRSIEELRENHPLYSDQFKKGNLSSQILKWTTGAGYYTAKLVANATGSHIITDLPFRWKEVEFDRKSSGADLGGWEPFAKAFQNSRLKFLENVPLEAALSLRTEQRLENMRSFLRTVWRASRETDLFSEENAVSLADELMVHVREADEEWKKIDRDLGQLLALDGGAAMMALSSGIAAGRVGMFAGGAILAGFGAVAASWMRRRDFPDRYPAAFFLGLK